MNRYAKNLLVLNLVFLINLVFLAFAANAEEAKWAPKDLRKQKVAAKGRRIASIGPANQNAYKSTRAYQPNDGLEVKAGISLGAGLQKDSTSYAGNPSDQAYGAAPSVGVSVDLRFARYFGVEQDAYFQLAGKTPDLGGATDSLQSMGSLTAVKGQIPFSLGDVRLAPKAGVGFAYLKNTAKSESPTGTVDASSSTTGAFGMIGLDIEPMQNVTVSVDYAKSLSASHTAKNGVSELAADSAGFDRIRAAALYKFMPKMQGGLQYIQRGTTSSFSTLTPGSNQDANTSLRQIQAVFQYEL